MVKVKEYAVCEFTIVGGGLEMMYYNNEIMSLDNPTIIEIAAVKLRGNEIAERFHTFAQIDGFEPENIEFEKHRAFRGVTPKMLIGSPALENALNGFSLFTNGCTLILRNEWPYEPLKALRRCGRRYGLRFNNPVIRIADIVCAADVMENYNKIGRSDILKIASGMIAECTWERLFKKYEVAVCRDDCTGYAHAFAELIVKLSHSK